MAIPTQIRVQARKRRRPMACYDAYRKHDSRCLDVQVQVMRVSLLLPGSCRLHLDLGLHRRLHRHHSGRSDLQIQPRNPAIQPPHHHRITRKSHLSHRSAPSPQSQPNPTQPKRNTNPAQGRKRNPRLQRNPHAPQPTPQRLPGPNPLRPHGRNNHKTLPTLPFLLLPLLGGRRARLRHRLPGHGRHQHRAPAGRRDGGAGGHERRDCGAGVDVCAADDAGVGGYVGGGVVG
ncbi:hypothetical protein M8818_002591 [Zalaria obscura]|uniref:Uncharacterized protein n=1 Tax=Zalaria obscura TaxID=2024903 RepID=A0ACC3SH65_9PEZI